MVVSVATAAPPLQPLPPPVYSFDEQSPQVQDGTVTADSVLQVMGGVAIEVPVPVLDGNALGLGQPGDQLDALSLNHAGLSPTATFSILFSVDRATVGAAPPDPLLTSQGVPFNVQDQAAKGHAAGDQFISLGLFQFGAAARSQVLGSGSNNSQVRNNFDEGGVDFAAKPETSSSGSAGPPQDNVNSTSGAAAATVAGIVGGVYFSACRDARSTCNSPSLALLPGGATPSGANLYFNANPGTPGTMTTLFASFANLGLQQDDDISAVVVLDFDGNGVFDGADRVVYSLAPGSPSLAFFTDASPVGAAADVFVVTPSGVRTVLASAARLGLGAPTDNIDALELFPCVDGLACALEHGIRAEVIPTVSQWGLVVLALLVLSAGGVIVRRTRRRTIVR